MELMWATIRVLLIWLLLVSPCFGATYYVDYEAGDDTNNGTTTGTPWQHTPWDSRATGTADSASLSAGDNLYFNRGTIYSMDTTISGDLFEVDDDGDPGNQITIGAYGSGDPPIIVGGIAIDESQFDLDSGTPGTDAVYEATNAELGTTNATILSFAEATNYDQFYPLADMYREEGSSSISRYARFYQANSSAGTVVYIRTSDDDTPVGKDMYAVWGVNCFDLGANDGYKFENLRIIGFTDRAITTTSTAASGYALEISNMQIWWTEWGIRAATSSIWIHDSDFRFNMFANTGGAVSYCGYSDTPCLVEDSGFRRYANALFFGESSSNVAIVRRNFFMDSHGVYGAYNGQHAIRIDEVGQSAYIYRNIFYNNGNDGGAFDNGVVLGTLYFWNNTFMEDISTGGSANNYTLQYNYTTNPVLDSRNNVYVQRQQITCTSGCSEPNWGSSTIEYNYYLNDDDVFYTWRMANIGNVSTLAGMQSRSGLVTNSYLDDWNDINLLDYFQSVTYGNANFLKPKGGGPLIDVGATITTGENEVDFGGNTVVGAFDIGAYEYAGGPDVTAPTPDPMTWASEPAEDSPTQISMTSTTGSDSSPPIEYNFDYDQANSICGADGGTGGTDSGWQSADTTYSDTVDEPNHCYAYRVQARDAIPNTGTASAFSADYTAANTPGAPILSNATLTTLDIQNDANGNPTVNPGTTYAIQVVTTSPEDATWLNKWIDASGDPQAAEVWLSDATWDAITLQGLTSATTYGAKSKARNGDNTATPLSAEGQYTTTSGFVPPMDGVSGSGLNIAP